MSTDRTDKERIASLEDRVAKLEHDQEEMEKGVVQFIMTMEQFLSNPKVRAAFGGHWMSPETAAEIERRLSGESVGAGEDTPAAPPAGS